jgi:hypothetical protein
VIGAFLFLEVFENAYSVEVYMLVKMEMKTLVQKSMKYHQLQHGYKAMFTRDMVRASKVLF